MLVVIRIIISQIYGILYIILLMGWHTHAHSLDGETVVIVDRRTITFTLILLLQLNMDINNVHQQLLC